MAVGRRLTMAADDDEYFIDLLSPEDQKRELIQAVARADSLSALVNTTAASAKKQKITSTLPTPIYPDARTYIGHVNGKQFVTMIARLGCLGKNIVLDFNDTGMRVRQMDSANIMLAELFVPRTDFAAYKLPVVAVTYTVAYEQLHGIMHTLNQEHTVTLSDVSNVDAKYRDVLLLRAHCSKNDCTRILTNQHSSKKYPKMKWRDVQFPIEARLSMTVFSKLIADCKANDGSFIEIALAKKPSSLSCTALASANMKSTTFTETLVVDRLVVNDTEHVAQCFAVEYLHMIGSFSDSATSITLKFGHAKSPLYCVLMVAECSADNAATTHFDLALGSRNMEDDDDDDEK